MVGGTSMFPLNRIDPLSNPIAPRGPSCASPCDPKKSEKNCPNQWPNRKKVSQLLPDVTWNDSPNGKTRVQSPAKKKRSPMGCEVTLKTLVVVNWFSDTCWQVCATRTDIYIYNHIIIHIYIYNGCDLKSWKLSITLIYPSLFVCLEKLEGERKSPQICSHYLDMLKMLIIIKKKHGGPMVMNPMVEARSLNRQHFRGWGKGDFRLLETRSKIHAQRWQFLGSLFESFYAFKSLEDFRQQKSEIPLLYVDFCSLCLLFRRMKILQSLKIATMNEDLMKIYFHWKNAVIFSRPDGYPILFNWTDNVQNSVHVLKTVTCFNKNRKVSLKCLTKICLETYQ